MIFGICPTEKNLHRKRLEGPGGTGNGTYGKNFCEFVWNLKKSISPPKEAKSFTFPNFVGIKPCALTFLKQSHQSSAANSKSNIKMDSANMQKSSDIWIFAHLFTNYFQRTSLANGLLHLPPLLLILLVLLPAATAVLHNSLWLGLVQLPRALHTSL